MGHWDPKLPVTSSQEPAWVSEAEECYRQAIRVLLDSGIPFVVGGAFAIHRHTGIWRSTKDIDFFLAPDRVPDALRQLTEAGFTTWIDDPVWLAKASRGQHFVDLITGVGNAALVVDQSWIEGGIPEIVLGVSCKVLGAEECLVSKMFVAFRERFDGADVVHLIRAGGQHLDWNRIMSLIGPNWELLYWSLILFAYIYPARTGAVPETIWTSLGERFSAYLRNPDANAPFRGSLVDPRMFSIDVEEWGERNLYKEYCDRHPQLIAEPTTRSKE